ncbi:MAG: DUF3159 domain-containing protein, partial [Bifidobacteriaceae bacterium]|nr:DUF3159 domain-containing protein [Bifidobacteriaceae bacterium]
MSEKAERRGSPAAGERDTPAAPDQRAALAAAAQQSADAKFHAIMGDEFSLQAATGGVRGMIEAIAPGLCFVVVYVAASSLKWAVLSSLAVAVVATVIRLIQRTPVRQALGGLIGVLIGVVWAWTTHKGQN